MLTCHIVALIGGVNRQKRKGVIDFRHLATAIQIGQTEISNGSNTVLTVSHYALLQQIPFA